MEELIRHSRPKLSRHTPFTVYDNSVTGIITVSFTFGEILFTWGIVRFILIEQGWPGELEFLTIYETEIKAGVKIF